MARTTRPLPLLLLLVLLLLLGEDALVCLPLLPVVLVLILFSRVIVEAAITSSQGVANSGRASLIHRYPATDNSVTNTYHHIMIDGSAKSRTHRIIV
jgi:hypothetical protein